jgi:threonine dehydrogenase-like Zn-dependent dehydrogenase
MRAAVLAGPQTVEVVTGTLPEPAAGQIRVRLEGCGVCASNVPVWEGRPWFQYPLEPGSPGHEGWGVVDALGPEVQDFQPGDRVALLSYHAFAEYDVAEASAAVPLPDSLRGRPVPGEPLGCAMNVFRRSEIQPGQKVAIIGIGFLGALLVQLAKNAGARVLAISRRRCSLELADRCGADDVIPLMDPQTTIDMVNRVAGEDGCQCVIEATGTQAALDIGSGLAAVRGRLVIAGYHQDGARQVNMQLWNWRGLDVINAHERDPRAYVTGIEAAVAEIEADRLDPFTLLTHELPLERLSDAIGLASQRPEGFLKAYVRFN